MKRHANFGHLPPGYSGYKGSRIVVVPVPYDGTSTWIRGSDRGPEAIIGASANMELYDIETDSEVCGLGIHTDMPVLEKSSPEAMIEAVRERVLGHIKNGKFVVVIGGEHSVSIGSAGAHAKSYRGMCVLQLDAHSDLRQEYGGSPNSHACTMARIREICPIVQVGIRSMDSGEKSHIKRENAFFAERIPGERDWIGRVVSRLSGKVYITIDLDVLDPSIMPSTGAPEPGGLLWHDVLELIRRVAEERELLGFDVVELCPIRGLNAPDFLAAKLIYKTLSYRFRGEAR